MEILPNIYESSLLTREPDTKMFNDRKQLWFQGPPRLSQKTHGLYNPEHRSTQSTKPTNGNYNYGRY